ncbi:MAG: NADH-quinone oxidoreductase subunit NuoF [Solirubrobacterales bacterium]
MSETRLLFHDLDAPELTSLAGYEKRGGYLGLRKALDFDSPMIIDRLEASGLRGRGGAGFSMGKKGSFVPRDNLVKYVACNADESEPGTFKDRELMMKNPHQLIEGNLIAAYAIGAGHCFIYIRGEYDQIADVLDAAVIEARDAGFIGTDILGSGFNCEIVIHRGAGAYICGEETGLLDSLEGKRGNPRLKPPFPAVQGLYDSPTLINNVETLSNVPHIVMSGEDWYRRFGTEDSPGTKVVSISGNVKRPGNYEIELGISSRELIYDLAGGLPDGRELKCWFPGGSSSPILLAEHLDLPYSFEAIDEAGSMLGSGAIIVVDDAHSIVELALRTAQFYKHESCGKCTPCREGTNWTVKTLQRVLAGEATHQDLDTMTALQDGIMGNCLCVLGDSMAMPVGSMVANFRREFEQAIAAGPHADLPTPADVAPPGPVELATGAAR